MIRHRECPAIRSQVCAVARAVRPYLDSERGPTSAALELARNVVQVLRVEPDLDVGAHVAESIRHRMRHGWVTCGDVETAARLAADAWRWMCPREEAAA